MALCKCFAHPNKGNFEVGKYYGWLYAPGRIVREKHAIYHEASESKCVSDNHSEGIIFSPEEYLCFFKDIHRDNTTMRIYIDRKKELLLVPEFENEGYPHPMPLNYFSRLPFPYTEDSIGQEFQKLWEKHKAHPVVSVNEVEQITPFYKIVTKGKGWKAFASGRWMLNVQFIPSEGDLIFTYWHKKQGTYYSNYPDDCIIDSVVPMWASCEEIGHTVLAIFEEAGII